MCLYMFCSVCSTGAESKVALCCFACLTGVANILCEVVMSRCFCVSSFSWVCL